MLLKKEWGLVTPEMMRGLDNEFSFEITGLKIVPHREAVVEVRSRLGLKDRRELNPLISVLEKSV